MSHTTKIKTMQITSGDAIERAIEILNEGEIEGIQVDCTCLKDATARAYYSEGYAHCDYVCHLGDASNQWDVGFKWDAKKEEYEILFDSYNGSVLEKLSLADKIDRHRLEGKTEDICKLLFAYGLAINEQGAVEAGIQSMRAYLDKETKKVRVENTVYA